ncbi:hypothetical protein [Kutzneria kofuensis]|uniref:DUF2269 family protein n=1 Tax=Kutzneria kofuensis TaxID=103725 RepID=A0A7W9KQT1_9PSEU|nr:hypothetical protein [Kutzneria kofuensis]MBB5897030.1 hypothetical protein [Kutzneria kofuensis]
MAVAALITWLLTAVGGFVMLGMWIAKGGLREPRTSHFPPAVIFGHFALAAVGLVVWIVYLFVDRPLLAWIALVLLVPVALLGFVMLARWIPVYRGRAAAAAGGPGASSATEHGPAERSFPVVIVGGHGLLAVVTVVLVLLAAINA